MIIVLKTSCINVSLLVATELAVQISPHDFVRNRYRHNGFNFLKLVKFHVSYKINEAKLYDHYIEHFKMIYSQIKKATKYCLKFIATICSFMHLFNFLSNLLHFYILYFILKRYIFRNKHCFL